MKYDLLIKGGTVVDPSQGLAARRDVAMAQGKVAAVEQSIDSSEAAEVLDASGLIVTPGLVDLHVHAFWGASTYGVDPDISNAAKGVTTALDAGSAGALTFGAFRRHTLARADTRLFALLNISAMGMISPTIGELEDSGGPTSSSRSSRDWRTASTSRASRRGSGATSSAIRTTSRCSAGRWRRRSASAASSWSTSATRRRRCPRLLAMLRTGDVVTHCFHGFADGVLEDSGAVLEGLAEAQGRGVIVDLGHGGGGFSLKAAEKAVASGLLPDTISSDVHTVSIEGPVYDLLTTMTKMLYLGLSLEEVVRRSTETPARALGLDDRLGTLRVGAEGDAAVLRLEEGRFELVDRISPMTKLGSTRWEPGVRFEAPRRLSHVRTILRGRVYRPWLR